ncbi:hypothetical protein [Streptomyces rochei]|nr:hypothetical protein [Streptomyces rochei]MCC8455597.1 hypothetical protein [Streptomyces rochei]
MDRNVTPECVISPTLAQLVAELAHDDDRRGPEAEPADVAGEVTTWAS